MQTSMSPDHMPDHAGNNDDEKYLRFVERMGQRVLRGERLFTTDAGNTLWEVYLATFRGPVERQYHDCSACRHFMRHYGGLVTIDEQGRTTPALWHADDAPEGYRRMSANLFQAVARSKVTGVFLTDLDTLGTTSDENWSHYAITPPEHARNTNRLFTAGQVMAEKRQDYVNVNRALEHFSPKVLDQALSLLGSDALFRSEKVRGPVQWLADQHQNKGANARWRAIAEAPAGYCHPRSSMAGTLLVDLAVGMPFDDVRRRFAAKMHPLQYQRPQAPPSSGNIDRAEKVFDKLGLSRALARRFARVDECDLVWTPKAKEKPKGGGIFGHLRGGEHQDVNASTAGGITWEKFAKKVLPNALEIDVRVPTHGNFCALVTAVHDDAPPILQWDRVDDRNPVSLYVYNMGSLADRWGLSPGWARCVGATLKPSMWRGRDLEHQGKCVVFLIDGAKDSHNAELALFPETLRSELREVRSVIEAHSLQGKVEADVDNAAAGLVLGSSSTPVPICVRVRDASGVVTEHKIDRWD